MSLTSAELVPLAAVSASAVTALSTIAGIRLANRSAERQLKLRLSHQDQKDQKEALRARLEELYQLIDSWSGEFVIHHTTFQSVMLGRLTYNQALDLITEHQNFKAARMFTLAELYFPKCHEILELIKRIRDEASAIQREYKELYREYGPDSDGATYSKKLTLVLGEFAEAIESYKGALASYAREV